MGDSFAPGSTVVCGSETCGFPLGALDAGLGEVPVVEVEAVGWLEPGAEPVPGWDPAGIAPVGLDGPTVVPGAGDGWVSAGGGASDPDTGTAEPGAATSDPGVGALGAGEVRVPVSSGEVSTGEVSSGEVSTGEVSTGEVSSGVPAAGAPPVAVVLVAEPSGAAVAEAPATGPVGAADGPVARSVEQLAIRTMERAAALRAPRFTRRRPGSRRWPMPT
ncbi:MAG: hypothetical protein V9E89_02150 [Ilumatobacteraceae bacterium]